MLIGSLLGKKYPRRKYLSVFLIVCGVAMFMGGGHMLKDSSDSGDSLDSSDSFDSSSSDGSGPFDSSSRDSSSWDSWDVSGDDDDDTTALHKQVAGVLLLIASLFFDGGTGAYEDKLMSVHNVEPFDLMFKFQLSKVLLSGLCLVAFNQVHLFVEMLEQTGFCKFPSSVTSGGLAHLFSHDISSFLVDRHCGSWNVQRHWTGLHISHDCQVRSADD
jgi:UDP-galactose transporter B1